MKIRRTAIRLATKLGADVEMVLEGSVFTIHITAPEGQMWTDGAVTAMRIEGRPTCAEDREVMWNDAINRMNAGLEEAE